MNVRDPSTTSNPGRRSRLVIVLTVIATTTVGCHSGARGPHGDALPSWPSDPNWQSFTFPATRRGRSSRKPSIWRGRRARFPPPTVRSWSSGHKTTKLVPVPPTAASTSR